MLMDVLIRSRETALSPFRNRLPILERMIQSIARANICSFLIPPKAITLVMNGILEMEILPLSQLQPMRTRVQTQHTMLNSRSPTPLGVLIQLQEIILLISAIRKRPFRCGRYHFHLSPSRNEIYLRRSRDFESLDWDFGDGGGSTLDTDPTHFYNNYGAFTVKLYAIGYGGCVDSASGTVNIYNPSASSSVSYTPLDACNSLNVDFTIVTPPQTKFTFFPGDGLLDSSQRKVFSHFYSSPNFYYPSILLYDNLGCIASVGGPNPIKVLGAIPNFARDRKEFL